MTEPTNEQERSAKLLGVSLVFADVVITIARLCEVIEGLQRRVELLERRRK